MIMNGVFLAEWLIPQLRWVNYYNSYFLLQKIYILGEPVNIEIVTTGDK